MLINAMCIFFCILTASRFAKREEGSAGWSPAATSPQTLPLSNCRKRQGKTSILFSGENYDNNTTGQHPLWIGASQPPAGRQLPLGISTGVRRSVSSHDRGPGTPSHGAPIAALYRLAARLESRSASSFSAAHRGAGTARAG